MKYDIRLEQLEGRPIAVVKRCARPSELSSVVPEGCGTVWNVVRSQHLESAGRNIAVYLDGLINVEVGVELSSPFSGHGDVVPSHTPTGLAAMTTHYGPYQQLNLAHAAIRDWCRNNGYLCSGVNWEIYGHWLAEWNDDPTQISTEVFYLIESGT